MDLDKKISELITDEFNAAREYRELADQVEGMARYADAQTFRMIAADEERHRYLLRNMILQPVPQPLEVMEFHPPILEEARGRLRPSTWAGWSNLGEAIKEKSLPQGPIWTMVNLYLDAILNEDRDPMAAEEAKRELMDAAVEQGVEW